jgi:hypothetical protein
MLAILRKKTDRCHLSKSGGAGKSVQSKPFALAKEFERRFVAFKSMAVLEGSLDGAEEAIDVASGGGLGGASGDLDGIEGGTEGGTAGGTDGRASGVTAGLVCEGASVVVTRGGGSLSYSRGGTQHQLASTMLREEGARFWQWLLGAYPAYVLLELTNAMLKVLPAEQAQALMDEQMSMLEGWAEREDGETTMMWKEEEVARATATYHRTRAHPPLD